jgi:hypothetical protein
MPIVLIGCAGKVDQEKFDPLYRAGKAIEGATSVGVNLIRYRELLGTLAAEVSVGQDKAGSHAERDMVKAYAEALAAYKDAEIVWTQKIEQRQRPLPASSPELERIVGSYAIQGQREEKVFLFDPEDGMQTIWRDAGVKLHHATSLYKGEPQDALPEPK